MTDQIYSSDYTIMRFPCPIEEQLKELDNNNAIVNGMPYMRDSQYFAFVGYQDFAENDANTVKLFSQETVDLISKKVTFLLRGLFPGNRPVIVPDEHIWSVLSNVYQNSTRQNIGDIYSRYQIAGIANSSVPRDVIDITVQAIVSDIKNNEEMVQNNNKLSIWDATILGEGINRYGLRQVPPIKIRHKRPDPFEFHMRY